MAAKRILAVENNALVLSFLEAGLTTAGYHVDTATNGREALDKIDRRDYDAIISDIRMPELDGLELCRELGQRQSGALRRLVLLTDIIAISDHQAYLDETGVRALAKPVDLEHLQSIVEDMVEGPAEALSEAGLD
jgi:CheY-like chemotaxis protein